MSFLCCFSGDLEAIERIAYELCEDQAASGVVYFETRYSPHTLVSTTWLGVDNPHKVQKAIAPRDVVTAVNSGLQRGEKNFGVKARSILCCIRGHPGGCMCWLVISTGKPSFLLWGYFPLRRGVTSNHSRRPERVMATFLGSHKE